MAGWAIGGTQRFATAGADAAASRGTTITAASTANTKGSWTELTASSAFAAENLLVSISGSANHTGYLVDIGVGAAGSETVLIPDLLINTRSGCVAAYSFPIAIPAATRIAARVQSTTLSSTCFAAVTLSAATWGLYVPYSRVVALGADATDSGGTGYDPGTTAHTKAGWTELTASTSAPIRGILPAITGQGNAALTTADWLMDVGVGAAASEQVLVPDLWFAADAITDTFVPPTFPLIPADIPAATRIAIRAQCSITTASDRLFDVVLYGVV